MENFNIKLNLSKLKGAFLTNIKGKTETKRCLVIPIDDARLFLGQKGCYLDLTAIEMKESQFGDTHCVKQNFEKDIYNLMSEEERKALPILGSVKPFARQQPEIASTTTPEDNDLPF